MKTEKYRYDDATKTLYVFVESENSYLFAMKNNSGISESELIAYYELAILEEPEESEEDL